MQSQYYGFTEGEKMQRILLKLSGEALAGEKKQGFDEDTVRAVALQVKQLVDDGIQVGIVIGGGNFWRGPAPDIFRWYCRTFPGTEGRRCHG